MIIEREREREREREQHMIFYVMGWMSYKFKWLVFFF